LSPENVSQNFKLKVPSETKFCQPDVLIESDASRVFIEAKIDSIVKLEQVQKYALLHATLNREQRKRPYLMLLTKIPFPRWWSPSKDRVFATEAHSFLKERLDKAQGLGFLKQPPDKTVIDEFEEVRRNIRFGADTWNSLGGHLGMLSAGLAETSDSEIEARVIDDFISELYRRGLVDRPKSSLGDVSV
jgi:hypothetical protein